MKKYLLPAAQAAVTVFLLWWIFRDPQKNRAMLEAVSKASPLWLIYGVLSIGVACLLQTWRWHLLLKAQDIAFGWFRTLRIYMIGLFFNLFLLGATGGDVIKIYWAMRETGAKKSAAFLSVLVDRMMGLLGLVIVTIFMVALRWNQLTAFPVMRALLGALAAIMGVMFGLVVFGFAVDRFHLARFLPRWLPLHGRILELSTAFSVYARDGKTLLATLALSTVCHFFNFSAFYCAARALGAFAGWSGFLDVASILPIIMTITALPISLSGVGVREGLFEKIFGTLYPNMLPKPQDIAVPASMLGFFMSVFWGIIGGLIYLLYRPSGGLNLEQIRESVSEAEKTLETPPQ